MNENYKFAKFIRINNKYKAYNDEKEIIKLYEKEVNNLQSKIDKAIEYAKEVVKEHNNGEYNVSTTELAIKEHKENIINILNILKEDK